MNASSQGRLMLLRSAAQWHFNWRSARPGRALRVLLGVIGWALLVPMLLIAYLIGLILLAAALLGRHLA